MPCKQDGPSSQEVQALLKTLPDKVSYPIMVPFGSVAFFPGRLIHTNECMVDVGSDVMIEISAREALQLLQARETALDKETVPHEDQASQHPIQQPGEQKQAHAEQDQAQQGAYAGDDQILDILEPYDEALHGPLQKPILADTGNAPATGRASIRALSNSKPTADSEGLLRDDIASSQRLLKPEQAKSHSTLMQAGSTNGFQEHPGQRNSATSSSDPHNRSQQHQQQQVCTQKDGEFEQMMMRFDDLERQEAAAQSDQASPQAEAYGAGPIQSQSEARAAVAVAVAEASSRSTKDGLVGDTTGHTAATPAHTSGRPAAGPDSTAAGSVQSPAGGSRSRPTKAAGGLRRGFFSKPPNPKQAASPKLTATESQNRLLGAPSQTGSTHSGSTAEKSSQDIQNGPQQTVAAAFTGNIVEHQPFPVQGSVSQSSVEENVGAHRMLDPDPTQPSLYRPLVSAPTSGAARAVAQPQKRVSKFKQARTAKQSV